MSRRVYWIEVKCALCEVGMGEIKCKKKLDGRISRSICPMCVARKFKNRKHAYMMSIPGDKPESKPKSKPKKKGKKK